MLQTPTSGFTCDGAEAEAGAGGANGPNCQVFQSLQQMGICLLSCSEIGKKSND